VAASVIAKKPVIAIVESRAAPRVWYELAKIQEVIIARERHLQHS
jgi:hypothetical protein